MSLPNNTYTGWTMRREMEHIQYYVNSIADSWQAKLFVGTIFASIDAVLGSGSTVIDTFMSGYTDRFGGDSFLIYLLACMMLIDLTLGIFHAITVGPWNTGIFVRGIAKYPLFGLYVFMVSSMTVGFSGGEFWLNVFVSYLIASETFSITKTLEKLGVKVPFLLLVIAHGFKQRIETMVLDYVKTWRRKPDDPVSDGDSNANPENPANQGESRHE